MFVKFSKIIDKMYCAVFIWYKKCLHSPMGEVNFVYNLKSLDSIEFLFEHEFMYARNRKWFSMIWFCIWFRDYCPKQGPIDIQDCRPQQGLYTKQSAGVNLFVTEGTYWPIPTSNGLVCCILLVVVTTTD